VPSGAVLRLYVLGALAEAKTSLTIFAEYKSLRGLSHIDLASEEVSVLVNLISDLRGYVEGGFPVIDVNTLKEIGSRLFKILITERTKDLFLLATGDTKASRTFLPMEIVAEDFAIAGWPWEYLYNSSDRRFITQEFHPVSRSIFSMTSRPALPAKQGKIRILMILGVPPDDPFTTPEEELKVINEVFKAHVGTDEFEITVIPASEYRKLQTGIDSKRFDIVHYFGHAGFDHVQGQGYLAITRPGAEPFKIYATNFAQLLMTSRVRLVFLNACKTAQGSPTDTPGRSSVAATLLDAGIPAVIGTQFSLPDMSAHSLSTTIYNALLTGKSIGEAVRIGRNAMFFADKAAFFDWGIPVLYSINPAQIIFPSRGDKPAWAPAFDKAVESYAFLGTFEGSTTDGGPSIVVERTRPSHEKQQAVKVAIVDIDAKAGFLPDLAQLVNGAQDYYNFEIAYIPVPSGYVRTDLGSGVPQTFVPRLYEVLKPLLRQLRVDFICAVTQNLIAGGQSGREYWNFFTSSIEDNPQIFVISTFEMRRYALEAKVSFAKAVFRLCLSELVALDPRWKLDFHKETAGCLFDFCEQRSDIIEGLRNMKFDHGPCRSRITDERQLKAIDVFLALDFFEAQETPSRKKVKALEKVELSRVQTAREGSSSAKKPHRGPKL
jgi:hypothetical protein